VEFAQVEQQMKSNHQLSSLVSSEKSAAATLLVSARPSWWTVRQRNSLAARQLEPERHEAIHRPDHHQGFERSKCIHRNHRLSRAHSQVA